MTQFIWHEASSYKGLHPIIQVSGVCFDNQGRVLLMRQTNEAGKLWNIPGGHPEVGETPDQTLIREVYEETTVKVGVHAMIGYQEVIETDKPTVYQLRYAAIIERVDPQQIDPAKGTIHERIFIPTYEVMNYIVYPQYRDMFMSANRWYEASRQLTGNGL
jgi:ADP-ribose pyrophosphatase YjhB (NUDIX family)